MLGSSILASEASVLRSQQSRESQRDTAWAEQAWAPRLLTAGFPPWETSSHLFLSPDLIVSQQALPPPKSFSTSQHCHPRDQASSSWTFRTLTQTISKPQQEHFWEFFIIIILKALGSHYLSSLVCSWWIPAASCPCNLKIIIRSGKICHIFMVGGKFIQPSRYKCNKVR